MAIETIEEQGLDKKQEEITEEPLFEGVANTGEREFTPELPSAEPARSLRGQIENLTQLEDNLMENDHADMAMAVGAHLRTLKDQFEKGPGRQEEIERLKAEIESLNKTVQKSEAMELYGQRFGFNKDETYAFLENKIKENEEKIRALESGQAVALAPGIEVEHEAAPEVAGGDNQPPEVRVGRTPAEMPEDMSKLPLRDQPLKFRFLEEEGNQKIETAKQADQRNEQQPEAPRTETQTQTPHRESIQEAQARLWDKKANSFTEEYREKKEHADRTGGKWGWVKERLKGSIFGINDFIQGGRFSRAKGKAGKEISAQAVTLEKTEHLSLEDALKEAEEMKTMQQQAKKAEMSKEDYDKFSKAVTARKEQVNNAVIKSVTHDAMAKIEKRLEKYRNMHGVKVAQLEKNKLAFRDQLITELMHLQDGRKEIDRKAFEKIVKQSFDPNYWQRYVWGGAMLALEASGAVLVAKTATGLWAGGAAAKGGVTVNASGVTVAPGTHGVTLLPNMGNLKTAAMGAKHAAAGMNPATQGMNKSIWYTAKSVLEQHGVAHASNSQIMQLSHQIAADNHIGVSAWKLVGHPMDTAMAQGYPLKFTKAAVGIVNKIAAVAH